MVEGWRVGRRARTLRGRYSRGLASGAVAVAPPATCFRSGKLIRIGAPMFPRPSCSSHVSFSSARPVRVQGALKEVVSELAFRVDPVAQGKEIREARIRGRQGAGGGAEERTDLGRLQNASELRQQFAQVGDGFKRDWSRQKVLTLQFLPTAGVKASRKCGSRSSHAPTTPRRGR